jgi:hypothetical protein
MAWIARHPTLLLVLSLALVLMGSAGLSVWWILRPAPIRVPDELPAEFPAEGFSHASLGRLLTRFVDAKGDVDYAAWYADAASRAELWRYLAALGRYSPRSAPQRFPGESERLAYWINGYNACVIEGVLRHWPIGSVQEVRAPVEVVAGLGFFGKLHFNLGGEWMSLHHLESEHVRVAFPDPRTHFVLNCASGGCPRLRPQLPAGPDLEVALGAAAREFVADPRHVVVDDSARVVRLSSIFVWYEADFLADLGRRGLPPNVLCYVLELAEPPLRAALERALSEGYVVEAIPYDWSLNGSGPG